MGIGLNKSDLSTRKSRGEIPFGKKRASGEKAGHVGDMDGISDESAS